MMLKDVLNILFPQICYACNQALGDNEHVICTVCRHDLPVTNFHFNKDDTVLKVFYGRCKVEQATALLRFEKKGLVQHLIHNLKYKGHEQIGSFLGIWLGAELVETNNYNTVDCVIPVPLHKSKMRKRGYNQVARFGQEIANALKVDYIDDVLLKTTHTNSQVHKNRLARWTNSSEKFFVQNHEKIQDKHILLVDDIITTGATLEACIEVLNSYNSVKISIATMAIA